MSTRRDVSEQLAMAEASVWLARLQGGERTPTLEAAFRAWLEEDPSHARVFARVTDTWEIIPGATQPLVKRPPARRPPLLAVAASLAFLFTVTLISIRTMGSGVYQTHLGEQQSVTLEDGSRVTLNTDTRLRVEYEEGQRRIRLEHGEALFEVAKNPQRPFIVFASGEQVRALGTVFTVRSEPKHLDVLLIEGSVRVSPVTPRPGQSTIVLAPGERLAVRDDMAKRTLDRPPVDEAIAWRRGEAMFDNTPLTDAMDEINRYGKTKVSVADPALAQLRISGVFATRDPVEFANVIAKLHDLNVEPTSDGVALKAGSTKRH